MQQLLLDFEFHELVSDLRAGTSASTLAMPRTFREPRRQAPAFDFEQDCPAQRHAPGMRSVYFENGFPRRPFSGNLGE